MTEILRKLKKYFDEDTLKYAVETDGMDDGELLDWLCRAAEGADNEEDWSWAATELEKLTEVDVIPEPALVVTQDGSWTEEAERLASPGELPTGPDGEDSPDIVGPHEEAKEDETVDLKELWMSFVGRNDLQDQGGIPRPGAKAKGLGRHEDPEPAYHRPVSEKENKMAKTVVRTSSVFYVQGLKDGKPFSSDIYRFVEKAKNGARGAQAAGLKEVRVVHLSA